jgi:hypothetical protein
MGDPFSGGTGSSGSLRTRLASSDVKLEAAKSALMDHLRALRLPVRVALFGFTSSAFLAFDGRSDEEASVRESLQRLNPSNGTDVAAAFVAAEEFVKQVAGERIIRCLLISDGLSDIETARAAAESLADQGVVIDVILINPTDDGETLAHSVAIEGTVTAVTSRHGLGDEVGAAAEDLVSATREADEILGRIESAEREVIEKIPEQDRLALSAGFPGAISHGRWYGLVLYIHLARLTDQVAQLLEQRSGEFGLEPAKQTTTALPGLTRGVTLTLTPRVDGIEWNPPSQTVTWLEDIQDVRFRLRAVSEGAGLRSGRVEVHVGEVLVALVPLVIRIRSGAEYAEGSLTRSQARMFERVFASYAHEDGTVVKACQAAYQALGIDMFIDEQSLRSGQRWARVIDERIERADIFQLFWSHAASRSRYVQREWQHALALTGNKGEQFVRPLFWQEDRPPFPQELHDLHFARLDLAALMTQAGEDIGVAPPTTELPAASPAIPATVVAVLPGVDLEMVRDVREDAAAATRFLEETTALRYYPVATLLVEEAVVKTVRAISALDPPPDGDQASQALAFADLLNSIAISFHVRFRGAQYLEWNDHHSFQQSFDPDGIITQEQFEEVREAAEWIIRGAVTGYVHPDWVEKVNELDHSARQQIRSFSDAVLACIEQVKQNQEHAGLIRLRDVGTELQLVQDDLEQAGLQVRFGDFGPQLAGNASSFRAALDAFSIELAGILPSYDRWDPASAGRPPGVSDRDRALLLVTRAILQGLTDGTLRRPTKVLKPWPDLIQSLRRYAEPNWRATRDRLADTSLAGFTQDLGMTDFLERYLHTLLRLLRGGARLVGNHPYDSEYMIQPETWNLLADDLQRYQLEPAPNKYGVGLQGTFSAFVDAFEWAIPQLTSAIPRAAGKLRTAPPLSIATPTFGIFLSPRSRQGEVSLLQWVHSIRRPPELALPNSPRVLLCLGAQRHYETMLQQQRTDLSAIHALSRAFRRSVLIHEHFHAIIETGLGQPATDQTGLDSDHSSASRLNEALAAWMELHAARSDAELTRLVWEYICAGRYPQWPYRGAEHIETIYQQQGISGVRNWINRLRAEPTAAQASFDEEALGQH